MWKHDKQEGNRSVSDEVGVEANGTAPPPNSETSDDVIAFVGRGVEFKGTITYSGTVRIDGLLDGEIHTDGVLLVGEEAVITARVTAGTIVCKGKITGDITAKEKVRLRTPAVISGGVKTPMLSIEEGVLFNGTLEMSPGVRSAQGEATIHPIDITEVQSSLKKVN